MTEDYSDGTLKTIKELNPLDEEFNDRILKGLVVGISEIEHYINFVVTSCPNCGDDNTYKCEGDFRKFRYPLKCKKCNIALYVKQDGKDMVRKLLLQEIDSVNPMEITTFIFGENTLLPEAGSKVAVRGTLRSVKRHQNDVTLQRVFDVNKIMLGERKKLMPTQTEIEYFKTLKKEEILESFAPRIMGMDMVKEGLIISLIGGIEQPDVRGDINIFLVGDPGTAKTQLLKFITQVVQPSAYAGGRSSSAAGLLAGVDNLADGTRIARAGPVVLCSGGVVCIDEMDKMNAQDRSALHEAMELQQFSLLKIGINRTWQAKTTIIGAANPHGGNAWNTNLSIKENIKLPDSLLSRFGLIFLIIDTLDAVKDLAISRHIMKIRQGLIKPKLSVEDLRKFFNYVRSLRPTLTNDASETLVEWYSKLRQEKQKLEAINVDRRTLEDLSRIAEGYAKWRMSDKIEKIDSLNAIDLLNESLKTLGMNTPGQRNESINKEMNQDEFLQNLFLEPITEDQAIVKIMEKLHWNQMKARKEINNFRNMGQLTELRTGELTWVN